MNFLLQEVDLAVEEEFANQLVSMTRSLPIRDIFQEAASSPAPVSLVHQESSQRALRVTMMYPECSWAIPNGHSSVSLISCGLARIHGACHESLRMQGESKNDIMGY